MTVAASESDRRRREQRTIRPATTDDVPALSATERDALLRIARSRQTPHGVATRARLVVDCADAGVTEAARRASVSRTTAVKWWQRYLEAGADGLTDVPNPGRPATPDYTVRRILGCALDAPPDGAERWTTRSVADAVGTSQATVSRIRRRLFPRDTPLTTFLAELPTSILVYVDIGSSGCALGLRPVNSQSIRRSAASPDHLDTIETIMCAPLLLEPRRGRIPHPGGDATALLRRAVAALPATEITLVLDVDLDPEARRRLSRHPITVHPLPGDAWFGMLHSIGAAIDPRQISELRDVQQQIRAARRRQAGEFAWVRPLDAAPLTPNITPPAEPDATTNDLAQVVNEICAAIDAGELGSGEVVSARHLAARSGMPPARVADALAQLAADALIEWRSGRYRLPAPGRRDVIETYTARGLLGTAIVRRLASSTADLPQAVDEHYAAIHRCDKRGLVFECGQLDMRLQDELARAASSPRIGSMFTRLTMQLRMFIAIFGLSYRYPTDEIVADDGRILAAIRRRDPEAAVDAWREKIDHCTHYMLDHLRSMH